MRVWVSVGGPGVLGLLLGLMLGVGAARAEMPDEGAVLRDCPSCPELVVVPAGRFDMGAEGGVAPERPEGPVHTVVIGKPFALALVPVTNAQYRAFAQATGHVSVTNCALFKGDTFVPTPGADWREPGYGRPARDDEPVVCVGWTDAAAYAAWLAKTTGKPYRLPSEAEFEYAARAGSEDPYPWGRDAADGCAHANLWDESAAAAKMGTRPPIACDDGMPGVAPVGRYQANAFGLKDMIGNVWQWVQDCYRAPYPADAPVDGSALEAPAGQACDRRSVRGGSWASAPEWDRVSFRGRDPEDRSSQLFGFRVARDLGE